MGKELESSAAAAAVASVAQTRLASIRPTIFLPVESRPKMIGLWSRNVAKWLRRSHNRGLSGDAAVVRRPFRRRLHLVTYDRSRRER